MCGCVGLRGAGGQAAPLLPVPLHAQPTRGLSQKEVRARHPGTRSFPLS
jgi:hypothetical protein